MKSRRIVGPLAAVLAAPLAVVSQTTAADLTSQIEWFGPAGRSAPDGVMTNREQVAPLIDHPLRDPSICKGPDPASPEGSAATSGVYFMTGTDGTPITGKGVDFLNNDGIRVWKSRDLKKWDLVGKVLDLSLDTMRHPDDSPGGNRGWRRRPMAMPGAPDTPFVRGVQAPEIHYLKDTFWIVYSISGVGGGLLKSESGKAEGPYADWAFLGEGAGWGKGTRRLFLKGGSPSLFQDDPPASGGSGAVYVLYHNGYIARLKDDMTGMAERPRLLLCDNPEKSGEKAMEQSLQVGSDGYFLKKIEGKYYLFATDFTTRAGESVQDVYVSWSTNVYGPYSERRWCIPHAGQTTVFEGPSGELLATYCGNDRHAAFRDRPGVVPLGWTNNDHPTVFRPDARFPRKLLRVNTERYPWHRIPAISRHAMRDTTACRGADGAIYYTGSFVSKSSGAKLYVYKSTDMVNWEELEVWDWDRQKALFREPFADPRESGREGVFSYMDTEIWFLNGTFYIGYSVYGSKPGGYLLKSTTGKGEGPYEPVVGDHWCQPSFFQDGDPPTPDGSGVASRPIYYGSNNQIVPWKPDMSGPLDKNTRHRVWAADGTTNIGDCSGQLVKIAGKYVMCTCGQDGFGHWRDALTDPGSYTWCYMVSDRVEGPWSRERVIGPHTGHGGLVEDRFGNWWACSFVCEGSMAQPCLRLSAPYIAPCEVKTENGELTIRLSETFPDYVEKALQARRTLDGSAGTGKRVHVELTDEKP